MNTNSTITPALFVSHGSPMNVIEATDKVLFPHMSWQYGTLSMRHILLN